jgi:hypothetical protein
MNPQFSFFSLFLFRKKVKSTSNDHILLTMIHTCSLQGRGGRVMACYGMVATCQLKCYHTQFQEVVIRSIPISDAVARVVAGERHGMCESALKR